MNTTAAWATETELCENTTEPVAICPCDDCVELVAYPGGLIEEYDAHLDR